MSKSGLTQSVGKIRVLGLISEVASLREAAQSVSTDVNVYLVRKS